MKIVRIIFVSLLFTLIFLVTGCNPGEKKSNSDEEQKKYAIPYNLTVEDIWVEQAKKRENIEFVLNEEVEEITGSMFVEKIILKSGKELKADGIFVAVWSDPNTSLVHHLEPKMDNEGCLVVDARQQSSVPGLYAAGDVTTNSNKFKQTIMSAAEWCLAANSIHEDLIRNGH